MVSTGLLGAAASAAASVPESAAGGAAHAHRGYGAKSGNCAGSLEEITAREFEIHSVSPSLDMLPRRNGRKLGCRAISCAIIGIRNGSRVRARAVKVLTDYR